MYWPSCTVCSFVLCFSLFRCTVNSLRAHTHMNMYTLYNEFFNGFVCSSLLNKSCSLISLCCFFPFREHGMKCYSNKLIQRSPNKWTAFTVIQRRKDIWLMIKFPIDNGISLFDMKNCKQIQNTFIVSLSYFLFVFFVVLIILPRMIIFFCLYFIPFRPIARPTNYDTNEK